MDFFEQKKKLEKLMEKKIDEKKIKGFYIRGPKKMHCGKTDYLVIISRHQFITRGKYLFLLRLNDANSTKIGNVPFLTDDNVSSNDKLCRISYSEYFAFSISLMRLNRCFNKKKGNFL